MPVRELDRLDGRDVRAQPLDVRLPDGFLGAGVEEHRVSGVALDSCLENQRAKTTMSDHLVLCKRADRIRRQSKLTIINDRPWAPQQTLSRRNSFTASPRSCRDGPRMATSTMLPDTTKPGFEKVEMGSSSLSTRTWISRPSISVKVGAIMPCREQRWL